MTQLLNFSTSISVDTHQQFAYFVVILHKRLVCVGVIQGLVIDFAFIYNVFEFNVFNTGERFIRFFSLFGFKFLFL